MARVSSQVVKAWEKMFEEVFFGIFMGLLKSEPYEEDFAKFSRTARTLTKTQLRTIARYAAEYFVSHAKPSLDKLSQRGVQTLKTAAIENALKKLSKEGKTR